MDSISGLSKLSLVARLQIQSFQFDFASEVMSFKGLNSLTELEFCVVVLTKTH